MNQAKTYIPNWVAMIHDWAHKQGHYESSRCHREDDETTPMEGEVCDHLCGSVLGQLMLIAGKLSRAAEGLEEEDEGKFLGGIADTVIYLFDLTGAYGIDLEKEIQKKMSRNWSRPFRHDKAC